MTSSTWISGTSCLRQTVQTAPRLEEVDAFSRERMLELLVSLRQDGYSITLFDWLASVPPDLRGVAIQAFRRTDAPPASGVGLLDLIDYVERIQARIRTRLELHEPA